MIFDSDGVILNVARIMERTWHDTLRGYGIDERLAARGMAFGALFHRYLHNRGRHWQAVRRLVDDGWLGPLRDEEVTSIVQAQRDRSVALMEQHIPVFHTTLTLIDALRRAGIPAAVGSANSYTPKHLRNAGIIHRFGTIVTQWTFSAAEVSLHPIRFSSRQSEWARGRRIPWSSTIRWMAYGPALQAASVL